MKKFGMKFTPETTRIIAKLHPENKKLIKQAMVELRKNPCAGTDLQEELYGFKSFKLKRFRVLYNINEEKNIIQIFHIGHRKDVYEQFNRLLNQLRKNAK
jgi:mRNA interferase RelE/StbE